MSQGTGGGRIGRRGLLLATTGAVAGGGAISSVASSAPGPLPTTTPEAAGFRPDLAEQLEAGLRSGALRDLHGVVLARKGQIVLERYLSGPDEAWGRKLGVVQFGPEVLHDLRSVTKSLVGLMYGIALAQGRVPAPEAPLFAQFPEHADLVAATPARAAITVAHVLGMTMGTQWRESGVPYTDPTNDEIAMEMAPDRVRYVLERPVVEAPGQRWVYSGGAVALLGVLIERGTGKGLYAFAQEVLFGPLGITTSEWATGRDGRASAASGARLRPADLLRIGLMVLAGGRSGDTQVVPAGWVQALMQPRVEAFDGVRYGWLWYAGPIGTPALPGRHPWMAGFGNGGQRMWLVPAADLVLVSVSGAYDTPDQWMTPAKLFRDIVMANLIRA
ncbi:MAG: serine hydrolase [Alphaproteobacteria bacterium]|nr:serine hydrolase [Alphaproteobacteria bacterium]